MSFIDNFWSWIVSSVNAAISWINTIIGNSTLSAFFELLLVVFAVMCAIHFLIKPILGNSVGSSDKVKKRKVS